MLIFSKYFKRFKSYKKTGLVGYVYEFSIDYNIFDTSNIIDIHKYLVKKKRSKITFGIMKTMFIVLLASIDNSSN